jgi:AcrR family transcriptional regulator
MKEAIKDERLKHLIQSAENVFFEKGFSKTSVSAICKAANCSRTTLYSHFENKENVYLAVINNSFKIFLRYFINIKFSNENGLEKMLKYAKGYIDFSKQYPKNYSMIADFYTLLRTVKNEKLFSDAAKTLSQGSFFPKFNKMRSFHLRFWWP